MSRIKIKPKHIEKFSNLGMLKRGKGPILQITPKGVVMGAQMLFEHGYLDEQIRNKIVWLYESGVGWESSEFRRLWGLVGAAASKSRKDAHAKD